MFQTPEWEALKHFADALDPWPREELHRLLVQAERASTARLKALLAEQVRQLETTSQLIGPASGSIGQRVDDVIVAVKTMAVRLPNDGQSSDTTDAGA